jgi:hypothetical protein
VITTLGRPSPPTPVEELAVPDGRGDGAEWLVRRATVLECLARRQWEASRRARGSRARALAATARQLQAEAQRLAAATSAT